MTFNDIFFDSAGRPRSGWRVAIFIVAFLAAATVTTTVVFVSLSLGSVLVPGAGGVLGFLANGIAFLVPALTIGWLCGKYLDRVPFRALGAWFTKGWFSHLIGGLAVGAATLALAVAIAMIFGGLKFELNSPGWNAVSKSLAWSFFIFAVGAAWEEVVFRGYILQTLNRSGLAWLGIAMTSLFFAVIHIGNPNATAISTIDTMVAGVWFGVAYLKTRDLWFVWGMHLIWNWMLGSVFGIEVSGITDFASGALLKEIDAGPTWLTGSNYGIEGGIASTFALIMSTVVIYFLPLKPDEEMRAMSEPEKVVRGEA
jgi:uncharacterized protein